ncbi:MAG TPA: response regulator [Candidatus Hydrogenedentes bacterium]|nr:response regulator [Candidatus Hydrogenedentota bacterium]
MNNENKILVVDDEAVIRELLTDILADDGYQIESVASAPAALDILRQRKDIVLLFTDIMMPEMNGIELIRQARKIQPSLIPIVMTGFATLETARAAVKEGAYDYVLKPFSLSEVKLAVTNALERFRLSTENSRLRELTQIFSISQTMAGIREEPRLHEFVLDAALRQVGANRGSLMLATPDGQSLEVVASRGLPREADGSRVQVGGSISGRVAQSREPLLVTDIAEHELSTMRRNLPSASFVSVPVASDTTHYSFGTSETNGTQVLAVLNVCGKSNGEAFSEADLKTLDIMAKHAAAAIENIRLMRLREDGHLATFRLLAEFQERRDGQSHGKRASRVAQAIAKRMGFGQADLAVIELGAALYDVGKALVSPELLNKSGALTPEEWESVRKHPLLGYELVRTAQFLPKAHLDIIRHHHERLDGSGYPDGLYGDTIPPLVRIMGLADAYVAMTSRRAYREPMSKQGILEELRRNRGSQFDPYAVDALISHIENGELD